MRCPVCQAENGHLATVCIACGSFIQQRIENLDLFSCSWMILERPARGFRTVAMARHKNYVVLLSALAGFAFIFGWFWMVKGGDHATNLINVLGAGIALGPPIGILVILVASAGITLAGRMLGSRVRLRDAYAIAAYGSVPLILTSLLFLPIEIMSFGIYFFASNPSPYLMRPFSYVTLLGLDGLFALWSLILLVVGTHVLFGAGWMKSMAAVSAALLLCGLMVAAVSGVVLHQL
ncbi:MAG TPA: Yip1 family protein [Bacteroidota bacterium]|nr:Yip1 family protein [Bacteroidota bacterium]